MDKKKVSRSSVSSSKSTSSSSSKDKTRRKGQTSSSAAKQLCKEHGSAVFTHLYELKSTIQTTTKGLPELWSLYTESAVMAHSHIVSSIISIFTEIFECLQSAQTHGKQTLINMIAQLMEEFTNNMIHARATYTNTFKDGPKTKIKEESAVEAVYSLVKNMQTARDDLDNMLKLGKRELDVGKLLRDLGPKLDMYMDWINGYEEMMNAIVTARCEPSVQKLLDKNQGDPACKGLNIESYCIMPIQRIPRYEMLIKEVVKHTDKERLEYGILRHALTVIKDIADSCNESKRKAEAAQKADQILSCVKKCHKSIRPGKSGRLFIKEGCLSLYDERKGLIPRYFFLFSDVLIWSNEHKFNGNSIMYRGHMPIVLGKTSVKPSVDMVQLNAKADVKDVLELGIQLIYQLKGGKEVKMFAFAEHDHDKEQWCNAFVDILREKRVVM